MVWAGEQWLTTAARTGSGEAWSRREATVTTPGVMGHQSSLPPLTAWAATNGGTE